MEKAAFKQMVILCLGKNFFVTSEEIIPQSGGPTRPGVAIVIPKLAPEPYEDFGANVLIFSRKCI